MGSREWSRVSARSLPGNGDVTPAKQSGQRSELAALTAFHCIDCRAGYGLQLMPALMTRPALWYSRSTVPCVTS